VTETYEGEAGKIKKKRHTSKIIQTEKGKKETCTDNVLNSE
jgi:hypothetical protein